MKILAIDPGCDESAYVFVDELYRPLEFGKIPNDELLRIVNLEGCNGNNFTIEMVASYGMAVGKEVFETVFWIGQFWREAQIMHYRDMERIYRQAVKLNLCYDVRAKDSNVIQALKDRFGDKGTKANPGFFYGFKADCWQAYALGVTYLDKRKEQCQT